MTSWPASSILCDRSKAPYTAAGCESEFTVESPISRYLNIRLAYFPSFRGEGQLAFISNLTGSPLAWQVPVDPQLAPAWPEQLIFDADRVLGIYPPPASAHAGTIYIADQGGNENYQLYFLAEDGSADIHISQGYEGCLHIFGDWHPTAEEFIFAANRRDRARFDLYIQSVQGGEAKCIWENHDPGFLVNARYSPDGSRAAFVLMVSNQQHELYEIDLRSGTLKHLNPEDQKARFEAIEYERTGDHLFAITDLDWDYLYLARLDLKSKRFEPFIQADQDLEALAISPDGRLLAYQLNAGGASQLRLYDLETDATRAAPTPDNLPGVVGMFDLGRLTFSNDSSRIAFSYTSSISSSNIYLWELERDQLHQMTRVSLGGLPEDSFVPAQLVSYATFDDRQIPAWFYPPKVQSDSPSPVIAYIHGGPESQFRPFFHAVMQYFLAMGYAVIAPNVRGSTGYGKSFSRLDNVEKRMDAVEDMIALAGWVRDHPGLDAGRIVLYGGSYGGFMVLAGLTEQPDLWAAGVDIVGISHFVTFLENTSDYRRAHREAEYGSLEHHRGFFESISPLNKADQIEAPLFVVHGANDPRVPLGEARQLVDSLERRDIPVELLVFDDEGHGLAKLKNKLIAYPAIADFLEKHVRGGSPPTNSERYVAQHS